MNAFAIVVGVDRYDNSTYDLSAAVSDAQRFAKWAVERGGVDPQDLRLLLSPRPSALINGGYLPANCHALEQVLQQVLSGAGSEIDRLYFYFAGHGLSTPGAVRGKDEPTILLSDSVEEQGINYRLAIGLSEVHAVLANVEPKQQFFFFDACRDFLNDSAEIPVGHLNLRIPIRTDPLPRSQQYILFAASTGQRALEQVASGRGCFGANLCEELYGRGVSKTWSQVSQRYEVKFSNLVKVISKQVVEQGRIWRPHDWENYIQQPVANTEHIADDPVIIDFDPGEIADIPLRLRLTPSQARLNCHVRLLEFVHGLGDYTVVSEQPPPSPVPLPCRFDRPPGQYSLAVEADGFQPRRETVDLCRPWEGDLRLERLPQANPPVDPPAGTPGVLEIVTGDASVVVTVRDTEGRPVHDLASWGPDFAESDYGASNPWQGLMHATLPPGYYYVALQIPGEPADERLVEVLPGLPTKIRLPSPAPRMGARQLGQLERRDIEVDPEGYLHASEALSGMTAAQLASVLSFAAFRAISVEGGMFRLESLGLEPFRDVAAGEAGLLVLIGVGGERPPAELEVPEYLRNGRLALLDLQGQTLDEGGFKPLERFPYAAQRRLHLAPGPHIAELRLPGFRPTRFALVGLPHRVTTLVLSTEEGGRMLVEQFLFPVGRQSYLSANDFLEDAQHPGTGAAIRLQHLETAQRYYLFGDQLSARPLRELLWGKWVDPLLGCLAGYGLDPRKTSPRGADEQDRFTLAAMHNMVQYFGHLPDSHVLAGIYEPDRRDAHFAEAEANGLPIFAEGLRELYRWHSQTGVPIPDHVAAPRGRLVFTSSWTSWVAER